MVLHGEKRARLESGNARSQAAPPGLFAPFRLLGLVTNHVPFSINLKPAIGSSAAPEIIILTCLGNSFALWGGEAMKLLLAGPTLEEPIASLRLTTQAIWVASGPKVFRFKSSQQVAELSNPFATRLASILLFGSRMLSLTEDGRHLIVWDTENNDVVNTIEFGQGFSASCMMHPATYLNKILVGSNEGSLQLWNIATSSCIFRFEASSFRPLLGKLGPSAVTTLTQSPAVDIVGIGFASGEVVVYDIRADERLLTVNMGASLNGSGGDLGRISAIGFRSDGESILATASTSGHIAFWDLNANASLLHVQRGAHDGAVTAMEWIQGQPLLLTSGDDNSVKEWLFDSPSAPPRLLRSRGGHKMPPHLIRYFGTDGKKLLSASRDRSLRCLSIVRDATSHELSQGSVLKASNSLSIPLSHFKLTPITSLSFSSARSRDWEDLLTAHSSYSIQEVSGSSGSGSSFARTWSVQDHRLGRWTMGPKVVDSRGVFPDSSSRSSVQNNSISSAGSVVRSVLVTPCGNFGLVGTGDREITMWNMQSGIRRRTFDVGPLEKTESVLDSRKDHEPVDKKLYKERAITGLAVNALNTVLVAATLDGTLNFFDFHTAELEHVLRIPSAITSLEFQIDSGLIALICDDLAVRLVDIQTRRLVRELRGFRGRLLDITFSHDSRWLVTTSLDAVIRTFDIPTGKLIDAFRTPSPATSVSFSPTGDFLASAHVDSLGVCLWTNRAQFTDISLHSFVEASDASDSDVPVVSLPSIEGNAEEKTLDVLGALTLQDNPPSVYTTPDQLEEKLVTLTLLPRSKWQTLLNLEVITARNKPKEPPKAPERAPFFIPTLAGVEHKFDLGEETPVKENPSDDSRVLRNKQLFIESEFVRKLMAEAQERSGESFFTYVKMLSPATLDLEVRSLSMEQHSSAHSTVLLFIHALIKRLESHRDFELIQSLVAVLIRIHGDTIVQRFSEGRDSEAELVQSALERLEEVQKSESERVLDLTSKALGVLGFVREFR
ncbi:Utp21-domain-containing protein [Cantharellus anzutake]|uniref:Utp21-domain-containing protein n=1 Tax=Cantharellus anzutake TaxID=1750568 RepID=UPI0019036327|nr:Utp21-domain-containing protein [Cantharellus anzutake]KAF8334258.1 Utp21-domain-containing protein [Cantharellus anzutake]